MRVAVVLFAVLFGLSAHARGDTILITSGSLTVEGAAGGNIVLNGGAFSFTGAGLSSEAPMFAECGRAMPCLPGEVLSIHAGWGGSDLGGQMTLNGRTAHSGIAPQDVSLGLQWDGHVTLPPLAPMTMLTTSFLFTGVVYLPETWPPFPDGSTRLDLTGHGTARLWFSHFVDPTFGDTWRFDRAMFEFREQSEEPIPEPATLALLGAGLAACAARRVRHRAPQSGRR